MREFKFKTGKRIKVVELPEFKPTVEPKRIIICIPPRRNKKEYDNRKVRFNY